MIPTHFVGAACLTLLAAAGCSPSTTPSPTASPTVTPADSPPAARTVDVVDRQFGLELPDPYRWMEGTDNAEFRNWLREHGTYTRRQLDALPTLASWRERLAETARSERAQFRHQRVGERVFFMRLEGSSTGVLMLHEDGVGERVLLDPATMAGEGRASITDFSPSPDGSKVAVSLDRNGNEISFTHLLHVADARLDEAAVAGPGFGAATWLPDGSGFIHRRFAEGADRVEHDPYQNLRLHLHRLGHDGEDPLLLAAGHNASFPLKPSEFTVIAVESGSNWALAFAAETGPQGRLCVASLAQLAPDTAWNCLIAIEDGITDAALHGDTLYLRSVKDSPNGRLLALNLSVPNLQLADARVVLPESTDSVLSSFVSTRDALYVERMRNGVDQIGRISHGSSDVAWLDMPFAGTLSGLRGSSQEDGVMYSLANWSTPNSVFVYDPQTHSHHDLRLGSSSPIDVGDLTSTLIEATSADGTPVPLSIVYRKDITLDGKNRSIVMGYGGYGYPIQPFFDPATLEWVKAGNVFAIAHVRGGGENGETWRLGGHGANKHKGVEDILACAGTLIERGYTSRERVALSSRSAGGLLIGGALAMAPDRFGAAFIGVGWLNPVRVLESNGGAAHVVESADPRTEDGLRILAAMDPYVGLREGLAYPPTLLTVGLNDPRVAAWETGKFAARMQTLSQQPVWVLTQADTGHAASTLDEQALESADMYAFFDAHLPGRD